MRGEASIVEQVRTAAAGVASSYGLDIFDVQFRREAYGMVLRVQIDRPGPAATAEDSVSVEDCSHVSRDLSAVLDVEDFNDRWPCSAVEGPGWFEFASNGDLVGAGGKADNGDGEGWAAFAQDCQAYGARKHNKLGA